MKQNRESTKGHSRWKVKLKHGKFEEFGLNNWSISKSQNGGRNQVSGRVSVPCWHATPVANAPWKPLVIRWRSKWNWNLHQNKRPTPFQRLCGARYNSVHRKTISSFEFYSKKWTLICNNKGESISIRKFRRQLCKYSESPQHIWQ